MRLMKVIALYHPQSEWARIVEEYARDFEHQRGKKIEMMSVEEKDGSDMARLYDIVRYPAIVAIRDNGEMLAEWQGEQLPLMNEVAAYLD
jgi:hypothetical protein